MAPPFGVHMRCILGDAELAQHRDPLRREGLVELDDVEVGGLEVEPRAQSLRVAGAGPMPMMRGATPAVAPPRIWAIGVRPYFLAAASDAMISAAAPSLTPDALPAVTVPPVAKRRRQPCQRLDRGAGARVLVLADHDRARPCAAGWSPV